MRRVEPDIRGFLRAAQQRRLAALALIEGGQPFAIYLLGYVAECALKAVILARTPRKQWARLRIDEFHGIAGHSLDRMRHLLDLRRQHIPAPVREAMRLIASRTPG